MVATVARAGSVLATSHQQREHSRGSDMRRLPSSLRTSRLSALISAMEIFRSRPVSEALREAPPIAAAAASGPLLERRSCDGGGASDAGGGVSPTCVLLRAMVRARCGPAGTGDIARQRQRRGGAAADV